MQRQSIRIEMTWVLTLPFRTSFTYALYLQDIDDATRTAISRVTNIIQVLAAHFTPLSDVTLLEAYEWAVEQELNVKDLLLDDVGDALVASLGSQ